MYICNMEDESTREIGGNQFKLWLGNKLTTLGNKLISKGKKTIIMNPSCRLLNPFTLSITFTVDIENKYQLVLQGDYKDRYKNMAENPIGLEEMYILIVTNKDNWFLKS